MTLVAPTSRSVGSLLATVAAGLLLVSVFVGSAGTVFAQPTPTINYQGKLLSNTGAAVVDGDYNVRFWLFQNTGQATTSALWTESLTGANQVAVENGLFSVMLGSTSALTGVDFNQPLFLGVEIGGTGTPTWDGEMLPRKPIGTVPAAFAAFEAQNATTLDNLATSSFLRADQPDTATGLLTFSGGLLASGSSTITNLTTDIATTTTLVINNQRFTSLLGYGLTNSSNALSVDTTVLDERYATTTAFDTESELESLLTDVTNIFTNNDGALTDDDLSDNDTDDLAEGATNQYFTNTRARAALSETITGLSYDSGTGVFSQTAGYQGLLTASSTNWNTFYNTPSTRITAGTNLAWAGNTLNITATNTLGIALQDTTGILAATRGGTGLSTITQNQLLIGGAGNTWTQLATSSLGLSSLFTTSAELAAILSDETGTGVAVFSASPTLTGTVTAVDANFSGNVGIGTTTPTQRLTVAGNLRLTGALFDSNNSAGTNGMVLQSTATGQQWVATSTLGISGGGGASTFLSLTDTPGSFTTNRILYTTGSAVTDSANFTFDGTNLVLGTDVGLSRGAANRLDLATGDSLNLVSGDLQVAATTVIDSSRRVFTANGALGAGTLAYSFSGDTNTGIYSPSADVLRLVTAGADRLTIDATGNVGIGTTTPTSKLSIQGTAGLSAFSVASSTGASLFLVAASGNVGIGNSNPRSLLEVNGRGAIGASVDGVLAGSRAVLMVVDESISALDGLGNKQNYTLHLGGHYSTGKAGGSISFGDANNVGASMLLVDRGSNAFGDLAFYTKASAAGALSESMRIAGGGNIGIGTTTPTARLGLQLDAATASGTLGFDRRYNLVNAISGAVQIGEQAYLRTTNTATTTIVGGLFRVEDSTAFGNTVRGFEVQTDRGTNNLGENTALSGFARTFGVRGTTQGDAGQLFEPAGVYGETRGTISGNALRGYSGSITSASLLSLFQDTSAFTGTGLIMNFGNAGGTFSSSTSKFVDFQNAGTSKFTVTAQGTTTIGDGTTNNTAGLQIGYGGLCVDNDGSCVASVRGRIASVSTFAGNSDLAEMYFSSQTLVPGEIVVADGFISIKRATGAVGEQVLGVVSTKPGVLLGFDDESLIAGQTGYPLALSGRVPVRLSDENGVVAVGDPLMLSSIPGIAMKATDASLVVGYALEAFDGTRAYTPGFLDQFGDDIARPEFSASNVNTDALAKSPCYFGAGSAAGESEADCDVTSAPVSTLGTLTPAEEAAQARYQAEQRGLARLLTEPAETQSIESRVVNVGQVIMFVGRGYHFPPAQLAILNELMSTSTDLIMNVGENEQETLWDRLKGLAQNFVDGVLTIAGIKADKVETSELCVDDVCVNASDLRALLEMSQGGGGGGGTAPASEPEPAPGSDPAPEPEPEYVPVPDPNSGSLPSADDVSNPVTDTSDSGANETSGESPSPIETPPADTVIPESSEPESASTDNQLPA
jgi:hypothetical protein